MDDFYIQIQVLLKGFLVFAAIIVAIGGQNAFVLKQALLKNHSILVGSICAFCDFVLIFLGVFGLGSIVNQSPILLISISVFGIIFVLGFASKCFYASYKNSYDFRLDSEQKSQNKIKTILATLAVTLLNPHVYLDTVIIVGGVGASLPEKQKFFYALGGSLASFVWFAILVFGAKALIPLFKKKHTWQILDILIGLIMVFIAFDLFLMIKKFL